LPFLSIKIKHLAIFFCFFDRLGKIYVHKWVHWC